MIHWYSRFQSCFIKCAGVVDIILRWDDGKSFLCKQASFKSATFSKWDLRPHKDIMAYQFAVCSALLERDRACALIFKMCSDLCISSNLQWPQRMYFKLCFCFFWPQLCTSHIPRNNILFSLNPKSTFFTFFWAREKCVLQFSAHVVKIIKHRLPWVCFSGKCVAVFVPDLWRWFQSVRAMVLLLTPHSLVLYGCGIVIKWGPTAWVSEEHRASTAARALCSGMRKISVQINGIIVGGSMLIPGLMGSS